MKKFIACLATTAILLFVAIVYTSIDIEGYVRKFIDNYKAGGENTQTNVSDIPEKKKVSRNISFDERIEKGDKLIENGYSGLAIKEYSQASKLDETKAEPYIKIGKIHLQEKSIDKAYENFAIALKLEPNNIEAKIYSAKSLIKKDQFSEATKILASISEENQMAQFYQGMMEAFNLDKVSAKKHFQQAIDLNTTEEFSNNARKFIEAIETFESSSGSEEVYYKALISKVYNEIEEFHLAKALSSSGIQEKNDYRDLWILLGYSCFKIEDMKCALDSFTRAQNLDPEKTETLYFLGLTYFELDRLDDAEKSLELALENGFEPALQAKQKLAEIYFVNKEYTEAVTYYESIAQENPQDIEAFVRPIWIYLEHLLKPEKALKLALDALKNNPNNAMSYNLLGWAYFANGKLDKAEENLKKALEIDPNLAAAWLNLGQLEEAKKNLDEAKNYYKKAYELGKNDAVGNLALKKYNELSQK
ncbi:tetratricopeptide repeat protein [Candidatus Peregrinibacteria bacterium]|nr:tetratricopeptide repeat protein [Candidatus Peregrinibacteria bacterium]